MACLDDETIDALVGGQLTKSQLAQADAHLDQCPACRELVVQLTAAERDEAPPAEASPPRAGPGTRIGRFVVVEPIGAGAMGVVYAAHDPQLDRRVALKLLRPRDDDDAEKARARLVREARAMAQLSHPHVVAVYDVGTVGASVFVAMELVEGMDLRRWCQAGPRTWRQIRDVYVQAAEGLAAAHAVGLVHRDFKPDNVLVGDDGRARVGDFGLARPAPSPETEPDEPPLAGMEGAELQTLTRTGALAGTPAYMAPEVLRGHPADERSDQFSLCTACYEALAGVHPRPASTLAQLAVHFETDEIEPPRDRSVPGWLLAVLVRGMSRRPEDRFASVEQLRAALRRDRRVRTRVGVALGAGVLMSATGSAFWLGQQAQEAPVPCRQSPAALAEVWDEPQRAAVTAALTKASPAYGEATAATVHQSLDAWGSRWVDAHRDTCEATRVRGEQSEALLDLRMACLRGQLQQLDALADRLAEPTPGVVDHAVEAVASLPATDRCANVDALAAVAPPADTRTAAAVRLQREGLAEVRALVATAQFSRAEPMLGPRHEAAAELGYDPLSAEVQLLAAQVATGRGRLDQARDAAHEALWAAQRSHDDATVAQAWLVLLGIAGQQGQWDEAAQMGSHAEAAVSRLGNPPDLLATLRSGQGIVHEQKEEFDLAKERLGEALALRTELYGAEHPQVAQVHTNLGNLARHEGRLDQALTEHRRALAIDTPALGKQHPAIGRHLHNIARLLLLDGQPDAAKEHYEKALAIRIAVHGPQHPDVARTNNSLGLLYAREGNATRAREHYREALKIFEALDHAETELVQRNLAKLEAATTPEEPPPQTSPPEEPAPTSQPRRRRKPKRNVEDPAPPEGSYAPGRAWDTP